MSIKILLYLTLISLIPEQESLESDTMSSYNNHEMQNTKIEIATFGAGCFWCVEAIFQDLKGVESVISGYSGGHVKNPGYKEVCTGNTGHAEVCRIKFDPDVITYNELLDVLWSTHDPTTLNRQGNDVGSQYRSVIFYHSEDQREIAERSIAEIEKSGRYNDPVVTEINPFKEFFEAEDYHQDYFSQNSKQPYCTFIIDPKVKKFKKQFEGIIK